MRSDEFEPHKLKRAKLYLDATIREVLSNSSKKYTFFQRLKTFLKKILKK